MSPGVAGGPTTASALAGPGARTSAHYPRWVAAVVIAGTPAVMPMDYASVFASGTLPAAGQHMTEGAKAWARNTAATNASLAIVPLLLATISGVLAGPAGTGKGVNDDLSGAAAGSRPRSAGGGARRMARRRGAVTTRNADGRTAWDWTFPVIVAPITAGFMLGFRAAHLRRAIAGGGWAAVAAGLTVAMLGIGFRIWANPHRLLGLLRQARPARAHRAQRAQPAEPAPPAPPVTPQPVRNNSSDRPRAGLAARRPSNTVGPRRHPAHSPQPVPAGCDEQMAGAGLIGLDTPTDRHPA